MAQLFPYALHALENTQKIADRCNVEIEFGVTKLPHYDVPDGSPDNFRYRTAFVEKDDDGDQVFVAPGANFMPSNNLWWRDLTPPERAKHYDEGNSK